MYRAEHRRAPGLIDPPPAVRIKPVRERPSHRIEALVDGRSWNRMIDPRKAA